MDSLKLFSVLTRVGSKVGSLFFSVADEVSRDLADGVLTIAELEDITLRVQQKLGDMKVLVHGQDVIDPESQTALVTFITRVTFNVVQVLKK